MKLKCLFPSNQWFFEKSCTCFHELYPSMFIARVGGEKVELPKHPLKGKWRNNMVLIKGFLDRTENKWTKPIPSSWINLKNAISEEKKIKGWKNSYSFILYINTSSSKTWKIKWSNVRWGIFRLWKLLSCVQLFVIPWTIVCQAPLSMEFSRQEYWSELPFPSPWDLPNPGIEPGFPALHADSLTSEPRDDVYRAKF